MKKILLVALAGLLCLACDRAEVVSVEKTVESGSEPETRTQWSEMTVQQKLMSKTWVLTGVKEEGTPADDPAVGNRVVFNIDRDGNQTLFFDCSENVGWTRDHTWAGGWIAPSDYGAVSNMQWALTSSDEVIEISNGYLLTFVQESMTGEYTIMTLTEDELIVDIDSYNETWTLEFQALTFPPAGYVLKTKWSDEFHRGEDLNEKWEFESGSGWGVESNPELQYYCAGGAITIDEIPYNTASVTRAGTLKIKAYKVEGCAETEGMEYISARMNAKTPISGWHHGYVEMKAKLPTTAGCWPAFWMLVKGGNPDVTDPGAPRSGEIDIMEYVPNDTEHQTFFSAHSFNANSSHPGTVYSESDSGESYAYCQSGYIANPENWHTYSMLWTHDYIQGFCDGVEYFYIPNPTPDEYDPATWPFDMNYYLKLNLAIGGSWGGTPDPNFTSATYEIDYVRVYQAN